MRSLWHDLRYEFRLPLKSPGFTTIAVLSLALGIANTAFFQLLNFVRLRSLPTRAPHELAEVRIRDLTGACGHFRSYYNTVSNPIWVFAVAWVAGYLPGQAPQPKSIQT
jgi:hypothetical protein